MSEENVHLTRKGYERFAATGEFVADLAAPDFVWDMSSFHGWPDAQVYEGVAGAQRFLREWLATWEDWELEVDELRDAGDKVVALVTQRGRPKAGGLPVDMHFAQVWTIRDGRQTRMEMYSDRAEALADTGLAE